MGDQVLKHVQDIKACVLAAADDHRKAASLVGELGPTLDKASTACAGLAHPDTLEISAVRAQLTQVLSQTRAKFDAVSHRVRAIQADCGAAVGDAVESLFDEKLKQAAVELVLDAREAGYTTVDELFSGDTKTESASGADTSLSDALRKNRKTMQETLKKLNTQSAKAAAIGSTMWDIDSMFKSWHAELKLAADAARATTKDMIEPSEDDQKQKQKQKSVDVLLVQLLKLITSARKPLGKIIQSVVKLKQKSEAESLTLRIKFIGALDAALTVLLENNSKVQKAEHVKAGGGANRPKMLNLEQLLGVLRSKTQLVEKLKGFYDNWEKGELPQQQLTTLNNLKPLHKVYGALAGFLFTGRDDAKPPLWWQVYERETHDIQRPSGVPDSVPAYFAKAYMEKVAESRTWKEGEWSKAMDVKQCYELWREGLASYVEKVTAKQMLLDGSGKQAWQRHEWVFNIDDKDASQENVELKDWLRNCKVRERAWPDKPLFERQVLDASGNERKQALEVLQDNFFGKPLASFVSNVRLIASEVSSHAIEHLDIAEGLLNGDDSKSTADASGSGTIAALVRTIEESMKRSETEAESEEAAKKFWSKLCKDSVGNQVATRLLETSRCFDASRAVCSTVEERLQEKAQVLTKRGNAAAQAATDLILAARGKTSGKSGDVNVADVLQVRPRT